MVIIFRRVINLRGWWLTQEIFWTWWVLIGTMDFDVFDVLLGKLGANGGKLDIEFLDAIQWSNSESYLCTGNQVMVSTWPSVLLRLYVFLLPAVARNGGVLALGVSVVFKNC